MKDVIWTAIIAAVCSLLSLVFVVLGTWTGDWQWFAVAGVLVVNSMTWTLLSMREG